MSTIEEKRVFGDRRGARDVFVASQTGVVRVRVNETAIGEFGLIGRCRARDIAADRGTVAVATDEDVLVATDAHAGEPMDDSGGRAVADPTVTGTAFGAAVAVGWHDGTLLAADADGTVARRLDDAWEPLSVPSSLAVRAIESGLVGADTGVFRIDGDRLVPAGLADVVDVSTAGGAVPLAATEDGLYRLANGWMRELDGPVAAVAGDPGADLGVIGRSVAAGDRTLYVHDTEDDGWRSVMTASAPIVAVDRGETAYAVSETGTLYAIGPETVRSQSIGVRDVTGLAIATR